MLERVLVAVQLAQHCAQVQMGIGEGFRLLDAQLQLQGLDQVGEGRADFARSPIVAGQVVVGCRFELQGVTAHQLCLLQAIETELEFLLLQVYHGRQVQVLTLLLGSFLKLGMLHAIDFLLDAHDLLHDVNTFYIFEGMGFMYKLCFVTLLFLPVWRNRLRKKWLVSCPSSRIFREMKLNAV